MGGPIKVGRYTPPSEDEYTPPRGGRGNINRSSNSLNIDKSEPVTPKNTLDLGSDFDLYADFYGEIFDLNQSNPTLKMTPEEMDAYARAGSARVLAERETPQPTSSTRGTKQPTVNPLISAITGYAKNISDNSGPMGQLQNIYDRLIAEIGTQSKIGRADIGRGTEQALAALNAQTNPYADLRMADVPAVTDPMSAYSQAVGAPTGGIDALQQMLQSNNAATAGGFSNLAQLLGASNTATQQSRIADVQNARTQGLQDLAQNQRTSNLSALQSLLAGQQGQQQVTQGRQDQLMQQLLGLAGQGVDVSQLMALLGGK